MAELNKKISPKRIGVLSFQGSFAEHIDSVIASGNLAVEVKSVDDLEQAQALIIPGGESTALRKLLIESKLKKEIISRANEGMPVYGTCAGAILLASEINGETPFMPLIDISVERNAYGPQTESFEKKIEINAKGFDNPKKLFEAVFIRAPQIKKASLRLEVLAEVESIPVMVKQGKILVTTFHPELTKDLRVHKYFASFI